MRAAGLCGCSRFSSSGCDENGVGIKGTQREEGDQHLHHHSSSVTDSEGMPGGSPGYGLCAGDAHPAQVVTESMCGNKPLGKT